MTKSKNHIVFLFCLTCLLLTFTAHAQKEYTEEQINGYKMKAQDQLQFFVYMLNTLGDSQTSPRDKDVIIRESYKKIFRDGKVQVEDDLSENRKAITNKDITAYLKDIEFFFHEVKFEFDIKDIDAFTRENGQLSLKVSLNRTIKGTGLEGEIILNTKPRFVELNLDKETDELAIVSIYTTKVSRDVALKEWWQTLSFGWKNIFKARSSITYDSVSLSELNKIAAIDSIDLSGNSVIVSAEPLTMLVDLKYINISKTRIVDLAPLSSLNGLTGLNISYTGINDLTYLRYAENIKHLNIANSRVTSLEPLQNLQQLESLTISATNVNEFTILKYFTNLRKLDLSETNFGQLSILEGLKELRNLNLSRTNIYSLNNTMSAKTLENLDVSFTGIIDLSPLGNYSALNTLNINNTQVADLTPLVGIKTLEKVYADNTLLTKEKVTAFKDARPDVIVVINSEELSAWWNGLSPNWKNALRPYIANGKEQPTKEQLAKLISIDSLNVAGNGLEDLVPLSKFLRLRYLNISDNTIANFDELRNLSGLIELRASHTGLTVVRSILSLNKLQKLDLSDNQLTTESVMKLSKLKNLTLLNIDNTGTSKQTVSQFGSQIDNGCTVIFDSKGLQVWWNKLDNNWQKILKLQITLSPEPSTKELHRLIALKRIVIVDEHIVNLKPLEQFLQIESLYLEKVTLNSLESVKALGAIKKLTIKLSPISSLVPLSEITSLEVLNLDNTAIEDLRPLAALLDLRELSVAGTKINDLKGLETLYNLQVLDISSTQVKRLKRLDELIYLKSLTCFNTRISSREVGKFREGHPDCMVNHY
ncbi:MAG TPA: leucine-rich repeat domain-containing protein [Fulvivirga sp.]|nr:leucine-rich repeat domain-containing protein [Fulvivirga sp.]